ncbi:MAG TPA: O-antigen ligase family protein [Bryobacteraceae bacterium]|nr:O-antigen ligase family protein [Bryobacteraceae bacterium]
MFSRFAQRTYIGVLAAALGYCVYQHGGLSLIHWNVTLLFLGLAALAYWLRTPRAILAPPIGGWLGWMVLTLPIFVALQMVRTPSSLLRILSPARAAILDSLENITHSSGYASFSITPAVTFVHLFRIIGYTLTFLLVRELAFRAWKQRSWSIVIPVIAIGALESAFGLIQNTSSAEVNGTYFNGNHFAGLLEMALPLAIGYAMVSFKGDRRRVASSADILRGYLLIATAVLILGGLLVSLSKMGLAAALCGLLAIMFLMLWSQLQGWKRWATVTGIVVGFLAIFIFLRSGESAARFAVLLSESSVTRETPIWKNTIRLVQAYPVFGSGLGTYGTAILRYQTTVLDRDFTHAHNDYLELLSELGGIGFLLLAGIAFLTFRNAIRAATGGPDRNTRFLALGCVGAMTAIAVHSMADFNLYIPANALVLAWITALAAILPTKSTAPVSGVSPRNFGITLAGLLVLYAPAWIFFETSRRNDLRVESWFCRFGICYTEQTPLRRESGSISEAELLDALRRDAASPGRWCDLGEARLKSAHLDEAKYCFSTGLSLAPYVPAILMRAARFYNGTHDTSDALRQTSRILERTDAYDDSIFAWYAQNRIPLENILGQGLPDGRSAKAYLRSLYTSPVERTRETDQVWKWAVPRGYVDPRLAHDYVSFLFTAHRYEAAARSWALYLGDQRGGYLESDWLYNGDFEKEPSGSSLDWRIETRPGVAVAWDANVAHTGKHSLRIRFDGKENIAFNQIGEMAFVTPSRYRFEAYIRTEGITSDQGVGFHLVGGSGARRLDMNTERLAGTNDWKKIERIILVPAGADLLQVQVVRQPSLKFDNQISGTVWIDSVKLIKLK